MSLTAEMRETITIVPSAQVLGADVVGLDLSRRPTEEELAIVNQAWADHLVLRFRGQQHLTVQELADFSQCFGVLDQAPIDSVDLNRVESALPREITVISNVKVGGKSVGALGSYEAIWHTDMTYNVRPPKGSCLYAVEIPPAGGGTHFANMYLAYETLPADIKEKIATLKCIHDASRNSAGELRVGYEDITDPSKTVGAVHPLVRTHPVTHKKCLMLGRRRNAYVVGLPLEESEALLNRLWTHATTVDLTWEQVWQVGDVIMWDNRCTMHRRDSFDPNSRRLLYRTQITGEDVE